MWKLINYGPFRKLWDANVDEITYLSKDGVGAYTLYNRTIPILIVSARDFLVDFMTYRDTKSGTIYIVISDNETLLEKYPERPGVVRAKLPLGGWIITPDPQNHNRCYCQLVAELDLKGLIPQFIVR